VRYEIDLEALVDFVATQVEKIETAAVAEQYGGLTVPTVPGESTSADELRVLWLAAGLATHVGLAIFREPERFITSPTPSPASPAALAA
jgi:hypothetical protein